MNQTDTAPPTLPRPTGSSYSTWIRAGFFGALGVALLFVLAFMAQRLARAALDIGAPFAIATVLALLLDPLVDRMEARNMRRGFAVTLVFLGLLLILGATAWYGIPALVSQTGQLTEKGPQYIADLRGTVNTFLQHHKRIMGVRLPRNFDALSSQISAQATQFLSRSTGSVTAFLLGSISTLLEIVITLIVTFYLLLDIDRLRARLFYLMPTKWRGPMNVMGKDVGQVFSNYLRGLLIVSALYGLFTMLLLFGLALIHRNMAGYALLVGVAGGILYSVPYLGPLVTALITFLVAFAAGGIGFGGIAVAATLVLNQIFDNLVTPRVVGGGVGLHPVASLFALTLGGALFGLWGLLLSVPIAASIQAILFRLFPKLIMPTPDTFLRAQGVRPDEPESAKILEGEDAAAAKS